MTRTLSMSNTLTVPQSDAANVSSVANDGPAVSFLSATAIRVFIFCMGLLSVLTAAGRFDVGAASGKAWVAYDGSHYVYLTQHGYPTSRSHPSFFEIAYFPAYPTLARTLLTWFTADHALLVVSNLCSLVGFVFLYSWVRKLTNARTAVVCTLLIATYPGAVFFSAALTEGPFFMLAAMTLWLLQRQKLWLAATVCAVATLTRPTGVALAITVSIYALFQLSQLPMIKRLAQTAVIGLLAASGGMSYEAFLWQRFGSYDAYFQAQEYWEREESAMMDLQKKSPTMRRYSVSFFVDRALRPQAWNRLIALAFAAVLVIGFIRPGPIPRVLYLLPLIIFLMTALPNHGLRASSIIRYETAGIPVFALIAVWLSQIQRKAVLVWILCAQLAVQIYYAVLFSRGIWVG